MIEKIPLAKPYVGKEEIKALTQVIRSGQLSLGPKLPEFEKKFAALIGVRHAVAVNSGTSGLHLCLKSLNIKPGDEVITTSFSFVASSNPVIYEGAKPVFADIDEKTYNIDPEKLKAAITNKTKALVIVHLFGQPCDMDAIMKIAGERDIPVIEDACEALGAKYNKRPVGTFGKAAVFAFYPNKQITTGEGGMIVTDDDAIASFCRSVRNQGRDDTGEWLNHVRIGFNYRLDEMSCAVGVEQLKKLKFIIKRRAEIAVQYNKRFKDIKGLIIPYTAKNVDMSWWVYYLKVSQGIDRDVILEYLNKNGVNARAYFFPPIHLQPVYKEKFGYSGGELPVVERVSASGFIIPFFVGMTAKQIDKVCSVVEEAFEEMP
jgi:perosamine synthetase